MSTSSQVQAILDEVNKKHGKGLSILTTLSKLNLRTEPYSSGILALDYVFGGGFFPRKIYEIYGPEASGKSLVLYQTIASIQRQGKVAALYDSERAGDTREWLEYNGVNVDDLIYIVGPAEHGMEALLTVAKSPNTGLIAIDSLAAMATNLEMSHDMSDREVASIAGLLPKFFKRFGVYSQDAALVMINQVRTDIGKFQQHGEPLRTVGGWAPKFWSTGRLMVKGVRKDTSTGSGFTRVINGMDVYFRAEKNRIGAEGRLSYFRYLFDGGIDVPDQIFRIGQLTGVLKRGGPWISAIVNGEDYKAKGEAAFLADLANRPELMANLYGQVQQAVRKSKLITEEAKEEFEALPSMDEE